VNKTFNLRITGVHFAAFALVCGLFCLGFDVVHAYRANTSMFSSLIGADIWIVILSLWVLSLEKLVEGMPDGTP
jgi:hypothetical protein